MMERMGEATIVQPSLTQLGALAYKYTPENQHEPVYDKFTAAKMQRLMFDEDRDPEEIEEIRHIARQVCMVFRAIQLNSKEAREEPGVMKSVDDEMTKVTKKLRALDLERMEEWSVVRHREPTARRANSHFVCGEKGIEFEKGNPARRYKSRLVIDGHNVRNTWGQRVAEALNHIIPASLCAVRITEVHALSFRDGVVGKGDVESASPKAEWEGPPLWVGIPKIVWPSWWHELKLKDPVVPQDMSMYGSRRAGLN